MVSRSSSADPKLVWADGVVRKRQATFWSGTGIAANTFPQSFSDVSVSPQTLMTSGVVNGTALLGSSSKTGKTGIFTPTSTASGWYVAGSGIALSEGIVLSEGLVLSEGVTMGEP